MRALCLGEGRTLARYHEIVDGLADGSLEQRDHRGRTILRTATLPASIDVPLTESTELDVLDAVPRTLEELRRVQGAMAAPFPAVALFNRYAAARARLTVEGLGERRREAFGSLLDLGSGRERPLRVHRADADDRLVVEVERCPARSVVRLHWPAHTNEP